MYQSLHGSQKHTRFPEAYTAPKELKLDSRLIDRDRERLTCQDNMAPDEL